MNRSNYHLLFLLVICYFSFFVNNRVIYADIMESRNLVTAREIVSDGNWLIPTMNGDLHLGKPPLPTWIAACIERISPDNLPLQRAAAGIAATLMVFFLYAFAKRQTGSYIFGLVSAVTLCTSFNIILMGRTATWDIYCHSFMLGAIYFIFQAGQCKGRCWREFIWAGILLGLSFLGKGPVSFYALLLPFLIAYAVVYRPSFRGKILPLCCMVVICLALSLWWPILLYLTHKDLVLAVWDKESTAWIERSVRPWYYYWKFFAESGIWSLFLVTALIWPYWKKRLRFRKSYLFAVCWVFMILICLSLLPEKKTRYLLPILIPSAMLVAHLFMYWWQCVRAGTLSRRDKVILRINTLLIAVLVTLLPVGIYLLFVATGKLGIGNFILVAVLLEAIAVILFWSAMRERPFIYLGGVLLLFICVEVFILPFLVSLFNNPELKSIHAVREIRELDGVPFYYDCREQMRIEIVYEAYRKILPYCFEERGNFPILPFVLVSQKSAGETLPAGLLEKVDVELIGIYDDNKRPAGNKLHSPTFVHHVSLLTPKGEQD